MNKKGSELSMNVIIIAAIGVLILVILAMFIFRSGSSITSATSCEAMNGVCYSGDGIHTIPYPPGDAGCPQGSHCYIAVTSNS